MLRRAYQLRHTIDEWVEENLDDPKINKIRLDEDEWPIVLLIGNILNPLYELTLIVSRTTNAGIHLGFRLYDALFDHLNTVEETIRGSSCPWKSGIMKACEQASVKLSKYYSKTEGKGGLIYNLANVLDPTMKLGLYKTWDEQEELNDNESYEEKYKKEFTEHFRKHYEIAPVNSRIEAEGMQDIDEVMHNSNAIKSLLTVYSLWREREEVYFDSQIVVHRLKAK